MKGLIAAVLMMGMALGASASNNCGPIADLAKTIMKARQYSMSIVKAMEIAGGDKGVQAIVRLAYMEPRYSSDLYRENAATDFETEVYLICIGGK